MKNKKPKQKKEVKKKEFSEGSFLFRDDWESPQLKDNLIFRW